jgi:hypothetical protein
MGLMNSYDRNTAKALTPRVDGELLAYVTASPPGALEKLIARDVVGAVGAATLGAGHHHGAGLRKGRARVGGEEIKLPTNVLVAVTPDAVYLFQHKLFWGTVTLKRQLARVSRAQTNVSIQPGKVATRFVLTSDDGDNNVAFELGTMGMRSATAAADRFASALRPT